MSAQKNDKKKVEIPWIDVFAFILALIVTIKFFNTYGFDVMFKRFTNENKVTYENIDGELYYDTETYIVYSRQYTGIFTSQYIPYYASNGRPFIYDEFTGEIKEIDNMEGRQNG